MKKYIIGIIIGIVLSSSVVFAATLIDSKDVTYTPSDSNFDVGNVKSALDEIYTMISNSGNIYYLGEGTSFDLNTILPDIDYSTLTADNFIIEEVDHRSFTGSYHTDTVRTGLDEHKSFDNVTGILSAYYNQYSEMPSQVCDFTSGVGKCYQDKGHLDLPVKAYLVVGDIK